MSESNDYETLKKNLPQPGDRLDRVENLVVDGMPDVNFCADGVESWIEMKSPTEPKRSSTPLFGSNHKVSQAQKNWMLRQFKAGGNGWFLIATDKRWMLVRGSLADDINEMNMELLLAVADWSTLKPVKEKESWKKLRQVLTSFR